MNNSKINILSSISLDWRKRTQYLKWLLMDVLSSKVFSKQNLYWHLDRINANPHLKAKFEEFSSNFYLDELIKNERQLWACFLYLVFVEKYSIQNLNTELEFKERLSWSSKKYLNWNFFKNNLEENNLEKNSSLSKHQVWESIFSLFNSDNLKVDSCFSIDIIWRFLNQLFGKKEEIKLSIDKILSKCIVIDIYYSIKDAKYEIRLLWSKWTSTIYDEELFLSFVRLHSLVPFIRRIFLDIWDKTLLLNNHSSLNQAFQLLYQIIKSINFSDYVSQRNISKEFFDDNMNIQIFLAFIGELKNLSTEIFKVNTHRLINRSIYEILLTEVFYKNRKSLKKMFSLSNLSLSSFEDDHYNKIDNEFSIIHPMNWKLDFGIQLTSFESVDKKIEISLDYVKNELLILSLQDWLETLLYNWQNYAEYSKDLTEKYERWLESTFKVWRFSGHFPFFLYKVDSWLEDIYFKNLKILVKFINQCLTNKDKFLWVFSKDYFWIDEAKLQAWIQSKIIKFLKVNLDQENSSLKIVFSDKTEMGSKGVSVIQNSYRQQILILRWKVINHWVSIWEIVYMHNLNSH